MAARRSWGFARWKGLRREQRVRACVRLCACAPARPRPRACFLTAGGGLRGRLHHHSRLGRPPGPSVCVCVCVRARARICALKRRNGWAGGLVRWWTRARTHTPTHRHTQTNTLSARAHTAHALAHARARARTHARTHTPPPKTHAHLRSPLTIAQVSMSAALPLDTRIGASIVDASASTIDAYHSYNIILYIYIYIYIYICARVCSRRLCVNYSPKVGHRRLCMQAPV